MILDFISFYARCLTQMDNSNYKLYFIRVCSLISIAQLIITRDIIIRVRVPTSDFSYFYIKCVNLFTRLFDKQNKIVFLEH
jgi:hypothetical protein